MWIIAFLDIFGGEFDFADLKASAVSPTSELISNLSRPDRDDIEIIQVNGVAGVGDNRADIAGQEIFFFANTEHEGAAAARSDDEIGDIRMHESDAVGPDNLLQGGPRRVNETRFGVVAVELVVNVADEMGQDLGVRLGIETIIAVLDELLFQRMVILDHAIVNECDLAGGVEVWMRVLVVDLAVSGPARVTDSVATARRVFGHQFCQIANAPGALPRLQIFAIDDGDSGGIVSAIFKAAKAIQEDRRCFRSADVTNNSAHI